MQQSPELTQPNPLLLNGNASNGHSNNGQADQSSHGEAAPFERYRVVRRDGRDAPFLPDKIAVALSKAFLAGQEQHETLSANARETIAQLTADVVESLTRRRPNGGELHIEEIQDQVELALMRAGEQNVARRYVLYREERAKAREAQNIAPAAEIAPHVTQVTRADGTLAPLDGTALQTQLENACEGLSHVSASELTEETLGGLYDGIPQSEVSRAAIMAARARIENAPEYAFVAARLLLDELCVEVLQTEITHAQSHEEYAARFTDYIEKGVAAGRLTPALREFDLEKIAAALRPQRDRQFAYMGLQTLYDRYLIHIEGRRIELPQWFWMRVAMGLAQREINREARAIEFYQTISRFHFVPSTPTLFNSGTVYPQLSSCYLTTVGDDLSEIYDAIRDNALLSKFSGGLGNDWTPVRAMGAQINSTNGQSQGIVPFLKVANDTAVAVNQCFAPDTKIWTNRGVVSIECLNVGDLVLGCDAEYRAVSEVMEYFQDGAMVELRVKHASGPLRVTAGHPLLAIRGLPLEASNERAYNWLDKGKAHVEWIEAGQLQKGDYVAQVVPREVVAVAGFSAADARFYGLMLGDGHQTSHRREWGLSFNNETGQESMAFAHDYLSARGIDYRSSERGCYTQIKWSTHKTTPSAQLPFGHDDLYCCARRKRIAPRLSHLPLAQTLQLLRGLIEADGNVSRGTEITFSNTSEELAEGVRYQMLRLGVPTAARSRAREYARWAERSDGSPVHFEGTSTEWVVAMPAVPELAELVGCQPLAKRNWLTRGNHVFSRVKEVESFKGTPLVYDLKVEGAESYMTVNGLAHNGGKRQGAVCAYIEPWHLDVEEFLDLRKNTGDDRRRTHDMHTALWIPDLFMERVQSGGNWTLFSPNETPDLHDLVGRSFSERYAQYEAKAARGEMRNSRSLPAAELWRKVLTRLFETGHPWITFKDAANLRSPQQHCGVVHSSNLCCVTGDQRAVTEKGLLRVSEMFARGDANKVMGRDGVKDATKMFFTLENSPVVRVETREGYRHKVTPDHPLWVVGRGWVEARDLAIGDKIEIQQQPGMWGQNHRPDEAFLCGMIAGDGTFGNGGAQVFVDLWEKDAPLKDEIEATVARVLDAALCAGEVKIRTNGTATPRFNYSAKHEKYRLGSQMLCAVLGQLGFDRATKLRVPEFVWQGDRETVAAYLRGLYICDATAQGNAEGVTTIALASVDRELIGDVQILWANFGAKTSVNQLRGAGEQHLLPDGRGGHRLYNVRACYRLLATSIRACRIVEEVTGFAAHRGHAQMAANLEKGGYCQKMHATFTGLTSMPNENVYCLTVDSPEHAWTCNGLVTKNTEITLNTSRDEIAVCNLGSINLAAHTTREGFDSELLGETARVAMRMLDNVIDINLYPVPEARASNLRHRPVGLGVMGFQDALHIQRIPYSSEAAMQFADSTMEAVSFHAIMASAQLARERGAYASFRGSLWDQGVLPIDSIENLARQRDDLDVDRGSTLDWQQVRDAVAAHGMRNSNCLAIAPTATISNIAGVSASIEPNFANLFAKSNLSGEFTVINPHLVEDLRERGLWDKEMVDDLKYFDGILAEIDRVPAELRALYATAFEVEPQWLIEAASRRQKWIDMGQSLNLYVANPTGPHLHEMYFSAWRKGLKTTYYLRSKAATQVEKSTLDINRKAIQPRWMKSESPSARIETARADEAPLVCSIDGDCEACQ